MCTPVQLSPHSDSLLFQRWVLFMVCVLLAATAATGDAWGNTAGVDVATFHRDPQRTGWDDSESTLTPQRLAHGEFGALWSSPAFDTRDGKPARLYASPLYADRVALSAGKFKGHTFHVVFAASSNGFVYAVNAFAADGVAPGTILWRTPLDKPCYPAFDNINTGVLSTPVLDLRRQILYVTSCTGHDEWQAYALDITSGQPLPHWPVPINEAALSRLGIQWKPPATAGTPADGPFSGAQRGALNMSPDGSLLYVTFGESPTGWIVAIDPLQPAVVSAFATVASPHHYAGGIWGAGGAALARDGTVFVVTGTAFSGLVLQPHDWVQSVLELSSSRAHGLVLRGTYTPFNYCATAPTDIDLGSGGLSILPDLNPARTMTPQLLAMGGKQGNVYLLNRAHLPGGLEQRPPCSSSSEHDGSLLAPEAQPQFGRPGPLNVFGPYTELTAAVDQARGRSVPAYFHGPDGDSYLFVTGTTKQTADSSTNMPPCLARLKVVLQPGHAAYLRVDQLEQTLTFENPGSPVVTSLGSRGAIVWVLDENARRSAALDNPNAPRPVLYALDAMTLKPLWRSPPNGLNPSGKYNEPTIAHGTVFVGTDRIEAFGLRRPGGLRP